MTICIFCKTNGVSKEHLWGKWWQKYYPIPSGSHSMRQDHEITIIDENGNKSIGKGLFSNVGHPLSKTKKVVCRECNNTWMNKIEENMKSSFERIFINKGCEVAKEDTNNIKKWMLLKLFLIEQSYNKDMLIYGDNKELRDITKVQLTIDMHSRFNDFYANKKVPNDIHFLISNCGPQSRIGLFSYTPIKKIKDNAYNSLKFSHLDTCIFNVGKFIGVVTYDSKIFSYLKEFKIHKSPPFLSLDSNSIELKNNMISIQDAEEIILNKLEQNYELSLRRNSH